MRLQRLLSITIMLINRRKITAPELADHFDVSIRTIYRDIEAIQAAGVPVVSYQGHEGGFCIMENYRISRQVLTFEDICSILSTLKGINTTLSSRELDDAIEKIECLIPEDREKEFKLRSEQIAFDIVPWGSTQRLQEQFRLLHRCITEQYPVSFTYTNNQAMVVSRTVEPMTLLFKSYSWYLFGYCRTREDFRLFKLSRIRDISVQNERFSRKNRSYREVISWDESNVHKKPIDLELLFMPRARVKVEESFEPDQIHLQDDGFIHVTITFPEDEWIYSWLLSFADDIEIVKPLSIRNRFKKIIAQIQKKYVT